jgi:hypothetical protein
MFLGSRALPVRRTHNLTADSLDNVGSLTSQNPTGLHGQLGDSFTLSHGKTDPCLKFLSAYECQNHTENRKQYITDDVTMYVTN